MPAVNIGTASVAFMIAHGQTLGGAADDPRRLGVSYASCAIARMSSRDRVPTISG